MSPVNFQAKILQWFDSHGRKDLPWQINTAPYPVWVSEIMLQQTQVTTVIPYFKRFMAHFPDVKTLAQASLDDVLQHWAGLGYYARARNLHKTAKIIDQQGSFPNTLEALMQQPGIGQSTAGAIMSIAFQQSCPILDGNVKRVLARYNAVQGWPGNASVNKQLWAISASHTPVERVADYTQAMMDLGATVCTRTRPGCQNCPVNEDCVARKKNLTEVIPASRPVKKQASRTCVFILIVNTRQEILLQKRSPVGIWGGLWSLPEVEDTIEAINWCSSRKIAVKTSEVLPTLRHTFSHFHLHYTTLIVRTEGPVNFVMEVDQTVWYKAEQIPDLGLPAPVKRLLDNLILNEDNND